MVPPEVKGRKTELRAVFADGEELKMFLMIRKVLEYFPALVAAGVVAVEGSLIFNAGLACHGPKNSKRSGLSQHPKW
jgi:hypothetical protein